MPNEYSIHQVVALTGATHRQLQWWDEQNFVTPRIVSHKRVYSELDLRRVKVYLRLRKTFHCALKAWPRITDHVLACCYLLFADRKLIAVDDIADTIFKAAAQSKSAVVLIDLGGPLAS